MKTTTFVLFLVCSILIGYSQTSNQPGLVNFDEAKEKTAILAVITAETENFYKRDYEGWKKCYIQADYAFHGWNNGDGTYDAKVGWAEVDKKIGNYIRENPVPTGTSSHPKVERLNMVWKFYSPELAYLIYDEYTSDQEMKMWNQSKGVRLMEKQNGSWRIVNVTAFWDYKTLVPADKLKLISEK